MQVFDRDYKPKRIKPLTHGPVFDPGTEIDPKFVKRGDIVRVEWKDAVNRFGRGVIQYQANHDGDANGFWEDCSFYLIVESLPGNVGMCGEDIHDRCVQVCGCECHFIKQEST